ncbi:MAG TPA: DUF2232 domain-containing protein [Beijerinckiaceae bacterium]|jgi:hypothetical protein
MLPLFTIGIGAGLVSALLFAVVTTGSPLAVVLSAVAPLPIFIAALGWRHVAGLVAVAAGAVAIAAAFRVSTGLAFALGWGLPAWWIAYLALLGAQRADGSLDWYPLGRLLAWIVIVVTAMIVLGAVMLGGGEVEGYRTLIRRALRLMLPVRQGDSTIGAELDDATLDAVGLLLPFGAAASFVMLFSANLWLAAKAVHLSQRLPRPWPSIPDASLPKAVLGMLVAGVALAFAPGFLGVLGTALCGGLVMAFALSGLAFMHAVTRGRPNRAFLLSATYFVALLVGNVGLPALAILGLADTAANLRRRIRPADAGPRPNPPQT